VRVVEALAGQRDDPDADGVGDPLPGPPGLAHDAAQVLAVHELHGDVVGAADLTQVVDLRDVRVVEVGRDAGLVQEHLDELGVVRQVREDPLDHQVPLEALDARLPRQPHLGHPARGELLQQHVFPEGLLQGERGF